MWGFRCILVYSQIRRSLFCHCWFCCWFHKFWSTWCSDSFGQNLIPSSSVEWEQGSITQFWSPYRFRLFSSGKWSFQEERPVRLLSETLQMPNRQENSCFQMMWLKKRLFVFRSKSVRTLGKSALEICFVFSGFLPLPALICPLKLWTFDQNVTSVSAPYKHGGKMWRLNETNGTLLVRANCSCGGKEAFQLDAKVVLRCAPHLLMSALNCDQRKKALWWLFLCGTVAFTDRIFVLVHLFLCWQCFDKLKHLELKMSILKLSLKLWRCFWASVYIILS